MLGSLFNKVVGLKETTTRVFSCEFATFLRTPPVAASEQIQEIYVVHFVVKKFLVI